MSLGTSSRRAARDLRAPWAATAAAALALLFGSAAAVSRAPDARAADEPAPDRSPKAVAADLDRILAAVWEKEGLRPAPRCSDEEFVRRVHLDLVGTIPTALQAEEFLKDPSPAKRERLVEDLLASPGHARHFANQWGEVLVGTGTGDQKKDYLPGLFLPWLEGEIAKDRLFAAWVTELLTAQGTSYSNAPVNFTARKDHNPNDLAGAVSKSLLGVQIQCAQCHDHPYEKISQKDFQAFAAFWGRMRLGQADIPVDMFGPRYAERQKQQIEKQVAEYVKNGVPEEEARRRAERQKLRTREVSDLPGGTWLPRAYGMGRQKELGEAARTAPVFLGGGVYADKKDETRREALAKWIVDPSNPYTARTLSNRVWGWFLGRGIVHPVDDFNSVNPPAVPEALDLLTKDTAAHGFDVKRLVRIVTATRAYQSSSAGKDRSARAQALFAAGPLKPMTAQQSFDSLNVALGVVSDGRALSLEKSAPTALEMEDGRGGMMRMAGDEDDGRPDRVKVAVAQAAQSFFKAFDDDEGGSDHAFEGTVPQGLFLMNSRAVNAMLQNPGVSVVPMILRTFPEPSARVRQLFLRTLSREPTAAETARCVKFVAERPAGETSAPAPGAKDGKDAKGPKGFRDRRGRAGETAEAAGYADLLWVLVSSSEFGSNH
jgi:hypothetical protein